MPEIVVPATPEDIRALRQARERSRRDFDWSWVTAFDELVPESRRPATERSRRDFDWSWVTAFDELVPESRRRATAEGREPFRL